MSFLRHPLRSRGRRLSLGLAVAMLTGWIAARADVMSKFFRHDIDVITVTDVTEEGKTVSPATPAKPVRYKLIYVGETEFGRSWAGESVPAKASVIKWLMNALQGQGYLLADAQHPPELLLVFGWGMMQGGDGRPGLGFLGGEKVNLMWTQAGSNGLVTKPISMESRWLTENLYRMGVAGKVWDIAESDLFMGVVRAYTLDSETAPKPTKLWETRFGCPATGLAFAETMPALIKAAALNFGRETKLPVNLNATDAFGGRVNLGELKVLGVEEKLPAAKDGEATESK